MIRCPSQWEKKLRSQIPVFFSHLMCRLWELDWEKKHFPLQSRNIPMSTLHVNLLFFSSFAISLHDILIIISFDMDLLEKKKWHAVWSKYVIDLIIDMKWVSCNNTIFFLMDVHETCNTPPLSPKWGNVTCFYTPGPSPTWGGVHLKISMKFEDSVYNITSDSDDALALSKKNITGISHLISPIQNYLKAAFQEMCICCCRLQPI